MINRTHNLQESEAQPSGSSPQHTFRWLKFVIAFNLILISLSLMMSGGVLTQAQNSPVAGTMTLRYKVRFVADGADSLRPAARRAIRQAVQAWDETPPIGNTFSLIGLRHEGDWALATITTADPSAPLPDGEHTYADDENLLTLILVRTESGWRAAIDTDPTAAALLQYVPLNVISAEARDAMFGADVRASRHARNFDGVQQQYNDYKFPWPAGKPWRRATGYGNPGWHNSTGRALDFDINVGNNSDILAAAAGTVVAECMGTSGHAWLQIKTKDTQESLIYVHLDKSDLPARKGATVTQGQRIGRMYPIDGKSISDNCGGGNFTHLHLQFPTKPFTIDNHTFTASYTYHGVELYSTNNAQVAKEINIVKNPGFSNGTTDWSWGGDLNCALVDGVLNCTRTASGGDGGVRQTIGKSLPATGSAEVMVKLGNTSNVTKIVSFTLRHPDTLDNLLTCTLFVPPNSPQQIYVQRGPARNWSNLMYEMWFNDADGASALQIDNVAVRWLPTLTTTQDECYSPDDATTWLFGSKLHAWFSSAAPSLTNQKIKSGGWQFTVGGADPFLYSPSLNIDAADYPFVTARFDTHADACGKISFARSTDTDWSADREVSIKPTPFVYANTFTADMRSNPNWNGTITRIRLHPACNKVNGQNNVVTVFEVGLTSVSGNFMNNWWFEAGIPNGLADQWLGINLTNDKMVCNVDGQPPVAYQGNCAWRFTGQAATTSRIYQVAHPAMGKAGDVLTLAGMITAKNLPITGGGKIVAKVTYKNGSTKQVTVPIAPGSYPYTAFSKNLTLQSKLSKIKVDVISTASKGQFTVDNVTVKITDANAALKSAALKTTTVEGGDSQPAAPSLRGN